MIFKKAFKITSYIPTTIFLQRGRGSQGSLKDGQDAGKALLMIEPRIGELLPSAEEALRLTGGSEPGSRGKQPGSKRKALPAGISPNQAHRARTIAAHPRQVAEVIKEAEENEDIPTKTA